MGAELIEPLGHEGVGLCSESRGVVGGEGGRDVAASQEESSGEAKIAFKRPGAWQITLGDIAQNGGGTWRVT